MIYAIIILVAVAIAFVILVRRLPQAVQSAKNDVPPSMRPTPGSPKLNVKMPAVNLTPVTSIFGKLAGGLRNFKMPRLPKRTPKPVAPAAMPTPTRTREDFWQEPVESKPEPVSPTPPVADLTPVTPIPEPVTMPEPAPVSSPAAAPEPRPEPMNIPAEPLIKAKGRNLAQEAEDAFAIKDYKKAERLYLRLATEDPKNAKVYSRLGVIYLEQKTYEDARDALQAAIKLEPSAASRHFNLALCYIQLGSKAKAVSAMETALKHDPSNRKYRKMLDDLMGGRI